MDIVADESEVAVGGLIRYGRRDAEAFVKAYERARLALWAACRELDIDYRKLMQDANGQVG